jgi:hypothetical protein
MVDQPPYLGLLGRQHGRLFEDGRREQDERLAVGRLLLCPFEQFA